MCVCDVYTVIITGRASLRVLKFRVNPNIGDDGMSLISSELKYNNILTELRVPLCGLTAKGSLVVFGITTNCVVVNLCGFLIIAVIITTGATCISEVVMGKHSLQVLEMKANNIGDDGISAIAGALSNSQISELYISKCDITLAGAKSLAAGLLVNNSVKILDVSGNPITVKGVRLILQSTVDNGVCQEVVIYDKVFSKLRGDEDYRNDDEVKRMMITLEKRKIQEVIRGCDTCCSTDCNGNRR